MNSQIQPLVAQEAAALRRIANNQYEGDYVTAFGPGVWQQFFAVTIDDGKLNGEIDFYSERYDHDAGPSGWDIEVCDTEKLRLHLKPCRQNFRALLWMIRCLLGGRTLTFTDGLQLSRQSHLNEVNEHSPCLGVDVSFENYTGPVTASFQAA
jgi:hypothetical protein